MLNIIITIFLFVLLVTQKVLLLNEESLILLCFITFVFITINNLGASINNSLQSHSLYIKKNIVQSLSKLLLILKNFSILKDNWNLIKIKFMRLETYYKKLILILSKLIISYNTSYLSLTYNKKFIFINKIEDQTLKLLTTIILSKLTSIIKVKYFYNSTIKVNSILSKNTILLRECIQLINYKTKK